MLSCSRFFVGAFLILFMVTSVVPAQAADCSPDVTKPVLTIVQRENLATQQNIPGIFSGWIYPNVSCGADWAVAGPSSISAFDNCDGTIVPTVTIMDVQISGMTPIFTPISTFGLTAETWTTRPGMYFLTYKATDAAGNSTSEDVGAQVLDNCSDEGEAPIEGEPLVEGEGGAPVEGEPAVEGEGSVPVEGEPAVEGEDPVEGECDPWEVPAQITVVDREENGEIIYLQPEPGEQPLGPFFVYTLDCDTPFELLGPELVTAVDVCGNERPVHLAVERFRFPLVEYDPDAEEEALEGEDPFEGEGDDPYHTDPIEEYGHNKDSWTSLPGDYLLFYTADNGDPEQDPSLELVIVRIRENCTTYSGGTGEADDPYRISNHRDWRLLMRNSDDWDKHFIVMNDIDFEGMRLFNVGYPGASFTGVMDGQGFTLSNCTILPHNENDPSHLALFGSVSNGGYVHDLNVENIFVAGKDRIGGLTANLVDARLENCFVSGTLSGQEFVGGLVAYAESSEIDACSVLMNVQGRNFTGGLAGQLMNCALTSSSSDGLIAGSIASEMTGGLIGRLVAGTVSDCTSSAEVDGYTKVGGLIGLMFGGEVVHSTASGTVKGSIIEIGGFVGNMAANASIFRSSSTGTVIGDTAVGGFLGKLSEGVLRQTWSSGSVTAVQRAGGLVGDLFWGKVRNSYARGSVEASRRYAGGLIGSFNAGAVENCFSTGAVSGSSYLGGLVGYADSDRVVRSYWDIENSGQTSSAGGLGGLTADLTFPYGKESYVGWDFEELWIEDSEGDINDGYPYLNFLAIDIDDCDPDETPPEIHIEHRMENAQWQDDGGFYVYTLDCDDSWAAKGPKSVTTTDNCYGYFQVQTTILGLVADGDDEDELDQVALEDLGLDTSNWTGTPGLYLVHYAATDIAGNEEEALVVVVIEDNCVIIEGEIEGEVEGEIDDCDPDETVPVITISHRGRVWSDSFGAYTYALDCGDSWDVKGPARVRIDDNCDLGLVVVATITALSGDFTNLPLGDPDWTAVPGDYMIRYNGEDNAGNAAEEIIVMATVSDETAPEITVQNREENGEWTVSDGENLFVYTLEYGSNWAESGPEWVVAYDLCDGETEVNSEIFVLVPNDEDDFDVFPLEDLELTEENWTENVGTYLVAYFSEDSAENEAVEVVGVFIVDTVAPDLVVDNNESNGFWSDDEEPVFVYELECHDDWTVKGPLAVTASDAYDESVEVSETILGLLPSGDDFTEVTLDTLGLTEETWTGQPGLYLIGYTVEDNSGNVASASVRALVRDTQAPVITIVHNEENGSWENGNDFVYELDCQEVWTGPLSVTATDSCDGDLSYSESIEAVEGDLAVEWTHVPGAYRITYTAEDGAGNLGTASVKVVVADITPPVVTISHREENGFWPDDDPTLFIYTFQCGDRWSIRGPHGAGARDQCEGRISTITTAFTALIDEGDESVEVPLESIGLTVNNWYNHAGIYIARYTAADSVGNVGEAVTAIIVEDETPPRINITHRLGNGRWLDGEQTLFEYTVPCGAEWRAVGPGQVTAPDNCAGGVVLSATVVGPGFEEVAIEDAADWTSVPGSYLVRYDAVDSSGNEATAEVYAVVEECIEGEVADAQEHHPFDSNLNGSISDLEAGLALREWRQGKFPMSWAIRALYIAKKGGQYYFDDSLEPPLCWVPGEAPDLEEE